MNRLLNVVNLRDLTLKLTEIYYKHLNLDYYLLVFPAYENDGNARVVRINFMDHHNVC